MSTTPIDLSQPLLDVVRTHGGDDSERLIAAMTDLGLLEPILADGELSYTPTEGFVRFFGLEEVGIGVENGEWIRFE